jgi:hypothetical protein
MIGPDGKGRLNDWDLCRNVGVDKGLEGPRIVRGLCTHDDASTHICLQGTWQFMSTRLLTDPGSRRTITDDLESHFFVLMWTALHWVKHNQTGYPGIDMEYIFDQQRPRRDGIVEGGAGKVRMYGGRHAGLREVEFACKPFNELFWDLWKLFADYLSQRRKASISGERSW